MNKYFQLCESGTEEEDCNVCKQNMFHWIHRRRIDPGNLFLYRIFATFGIMTKPVSYLNPIASEG